MKRLLMVLVLFTSAVSAAAGQSIVQPVLRTAPLFNYEDAPATPDADDPAIWLNRRNHEQSLIIGTAKDAGLLVYDLSGRLVQAMFRRTPRRSRPPIVRRRLAGIPVPACRVSTA